jgi:2-dehydro-3-deoxyphosphogluconate aldolase / (4S)-4-hydroxy-2-oxoglutarate aldolase
LPSLKVKKRGWRPGQSRFKNPSLLTLNFTLLDESLFHLSFLIYFFGDPSVQNPNALKSIAHLSALKYIPIIRAHHYEDAWWMADAAFKVGFPAVEITYSFQDAPQLIHKLSQEFPHRIIGAGTVLSVEQAEACHGSGAQFMVSPSYSPDILRWSLEQDVLYLPGCLTPTEIQKASQEGALALKVFPITSMGGVSYLKTLLSLFPDLLLMPTGGITLEAAKDYLDNGAFAVGLGKDLFPETLTHPNRNTPELIHHLQQIQHQLYASLQLEPLPLGERL